ncbi:MAG TPA: HEPN domain-containing protein [Gammaproteobacteria bacterium]|nr:HEPN domain-containing protein [Gammaproteobacteria bacterium]
MSKAKETFDQAILDAENLLAHFKTLNSHPPPPELEVLKRAGLVMAMTAWETYVEDRLQELCGERLKNVKDEWVTSLVERKLAIDLGQLNNPNSLKTAELFRTYAGVDVTKNWAWHPWDQATVRHKLDGYIRLRGEVVHRSLANATQQPMPHPVTKADLEKAIRFLKKLVEVTEEILPG